MNRVKAFIERGRDGTYGVYVDLSDRTLNYGIHGNGNTVGEAIEDFNVGYAEMKELYEDEKKNFAEAEFEFHYDTASFFGYNDESNHDFADFSESLNEVQFVSEPKTVCELELQGQCF